MEYWDIMTENRNFHRAVFLLPVIIVCIAAALVTVLCVSGVFFSQGGSETETTASQTETETEAVTESETEPEPEVKVDPEAPTIYGVRDKFGYVGDRFSYMNGVFAMGKMGRETEIYVDYSAVDNNKVGVYEVKYTAVDSEGHFAETLCTVTIYDSDTVRLDVDNIMQLPSLPNGCEVVSLAIALDAAGYPVVPTYLFDNYMPHSYGFKNLDFWNVYVGDPRTEGCGCYAPCVVKTANDFLEERRSSKKCYDVSGTIFSKYKDYIDEGIPVIVWGTLGMRGDYSVVASGVVDGERVYWNLFSHCMVLIGYSNDTYIFCDPLKGVVEYDKNDVERSYRIAYEQACVIY